MYNTTLPATSALTLHGKYRCLICSLPVITACYVATHVMWLVKSCIHIHISGSNSIQLIWCLTVPWIVLTRFPYVLLMQHLVTQRTINVTLTAVRPEGWPFNIVLNVRFNTKREYPNEGVYLYGVAYVWAWGKHRHYTCLCFCVTCSQFNTIKWMSHNYVIWVHRFCMVGGEVWEYRFYKVYSG